MKKSISTRKVLNALANEYNEASKAIGYYRATGDKKAGDECEIGRAAIENVVEALFERKKDYDIIKEEAEAAGTRFTYYEMWVAVN